MAFTALHGLQIPSLPAIANDNGVPSAVLDAAGESVAVIGKLELEAGASGAKTLSAAGGGSITFRTSSSITFANAGTTLRIGLQDVDTATGLEDTTFDVHGDLTGGDALATGAFREVTMGTGTKTVSAGDVVAVVYEMTARGGADSVQIRRMAAGGLLPALPLASGAGIPYGTLDTGSLSKQVFMPLAVIRFDDGTLGWIRGANQLVFSTGSVQSVGINSGSTPDEYIGTFQPVVPMQINGVAVIVTNIAGSDDFEVLLYADPFGTPAVLATGVIDPDVVHGGGLIYVRFDPVSLSVGTVYGVAVRPTTANTITYNYYTLGSGFDWIKGAAHFGTSLTLAARSDQSGAFVVVQDYDAPAFVLDVCGLDDGAGGSGGSLLRPVSMSGGTV